MADAAETSYAIRLGPSLAKRPRRQVPDGEDAALVSVKYNFRPPSIPATASGYMHSSSGSDSKWSLEYPAMEGGGVNERSRQQGHGFEGYRNSAKDIDCVLVWDEESQAYVLDRVASSFTFKYDRNHLRLSNKAEAALAGISAASEPTGLALGLHLPNGDVQLGAGPTGEEAGEDDEEDMFARQLEEGLENLDQSSPGNDTNGSAGSPDARHAKAGLGIVEGVDLHESVVTPRGSPFIDRPRARAQPGRSKMGRVDEVTKATDCGESSSSTPFVSPRSVATSPRPPGADPGLSGVTSTWKPPVQRSNVAIEYDEDDDEGDEDSEEEDDGDDDDDDEDGNNDKTNDDDDDDLDAYALQLESSLQS